MASRFIVERFVFLLIAFIGVILLFHTLIVKILQDIFFIKYSTSSCTSGVILMTVLYAVAKFNKGLEKQIGNFLYFKGKHHYKVLLKEAITDGLTDLYDHKYLILKLEEEVARSKKYASPVSLLMVDIDHFKRYNDTFGHPAGDKILAGMANIFKRCSRRADTVARYGGEEFAIILPEISKEGANILAEKLRKQVETALFEGNINLTVSIGLSFFDGKDASFTKENFIKIADEALYRAKSKGRNRVES